MLFTVTEFSTQELESEGHSPYSQHRPAAKIMNRIRGFASWVSAACGAPASAGSLEEVTGWVPRGAENSKIGRRQGASIASALQDTPLTLSTGAPITGTHLKMVTLTPLAAMSAWAQGSDNKGKRSNHLKLGGRKPLLESSCTMEVFRVCTEHILLICHGLYFSLFRITIP